MSKPVPKGWLRISAAIYYQDAPAALEWLTKAFDFAVRLRVDGEDGTIKHSELTYEDGVIMVGSSRPPLHISPKEAGGKSTQSLMVYVDDVDAHCERARKAGAVIVQEPSVHDYGEEYWTDRSYGAEDLEGHQWWFTQRLRG